MLAFFLLLTFQAIPALPVSAADGPGGEGAQAQAEPNEARSQKEAGDALVKQDAYKEASGHYLKALGLPNDFDAAEKTQMAVYISWTGDFASAARVLREVLETAPENLNARIHLARILSWDGRLDEAISNADAVLGKDPGNRDALLIKANTLRWKRNSAESIKIYERLLAEREDFDAREGYAFALLNAGEIKEARKSFEKLAPSIPAQEGDYKELKSALEAAELAAKPSLSAGSSYYNDTDHNQVRRYSLAYNFLLAGRKAELGFAHVDAEDQTLDKHAENLTFGIEGAIHDDIRWRAGIGGAFKGNGGFLTGRFSAGMVLVGWNTVFAVSRDMMTDTAVLIENGIRFSDYSVASSRTFGRAALYTNYDYRHYSDGNSANDIQITPKYTLLPGNPRIDVGYRFRYLDFDRQSKSGFFDPNNFISHQALVTFNYENGGFYTYLEPYYGHQAFDRNGASTSDFFWGGSGAAGYRLGRASFEINGEGGNYAVGSAAGFKYYMAGLRVVFTP